MSARGTSWGVNAGLLHAAVARGDERYLATCERHGQSVFFVGKNKGASCGHHGKCYACGRESDWKRRGFAFTWAGFVELLLKQLGRCAICGGTEDNLDVDHCHAGGHVRGLLCAHCNKHLGIYESRKAEFETYLEAP